MKWMEAFVGFPISWLYLCGVFWSEVWPALHGFDGIVVGGGSWRLCCLYYLASLLFLLVASRGVGPTW